ncbi:hypothetical protein RRG08_003343 [Elysia crispata]|uniref:Uncharacterized protein n=1 Tax=Elysia crispata TaxID=231223 RepID=A0AAE1A7K8_9GAST|nr:hypothetical protein RRG08_003343 [Elysia crispata]
MLQDLKCSFEDQYSTSEVAKLYDEGFSTSDIMCPQELHQELTSLLKLQTVSEEEIRLYVTQLGPEPVRNAPPNYIDVPYFWYSEAEQVPNLVACARRDIFSTVQSADAERSFSLFNLVLSLVSDRRRSLRPTLTHREHGQISMCHWFEDRHQDSDPPSPRRKWRRILAEVTPGPQPQRGPPNAAVASDSSCEPRGGPSKRNQIQISRWNANGMASRKEVLAQFLKEKQVDICFQETHLRNGLRFSLR